MKAEHYHTEITDRMPAASRELFAEINEKIDRAFADEGSLVKICAGWYLQVQDGELVEFDRNEATREWVAKEYNGKWYSDPMPRLSDLTI